MAAGLCAVKMFPFLSGAARAHEFNDFGASRKCENRNTALKALPSPLLTSWIMWQELSSGR